jgi:hypothetical protein
MPSGVFLYAAIMPSGVFLYDVFLYSGSPSLRNQEY